MWSKTVKLNVRKVMASPKVLKPYSDWMGIYRFAISLGNNISYCIIAIALVIIILVFNTILILKIR